MGSVEPPPRDVVGSDLVWHYTDGNGLISILTNHVLWATSSGYLNDEQEVALGSQRILDELDARLTDKPEASALLAQRLRESREAHQGPSPSTFFVLSAAEQPDLLAMWRNYGGAGESYAIGLDRQAPLCVLADEGSPSLSADHLRLVRQRPWSRVRYDEAEHRVLAAAVFDGLEEELTSLKARAGDQVPTVEMVLEELADTLDDMEQALVLVKHEGFRDEREMRHSTVLMHPDLDESGRGMLRYRSTPYGIAPYLWLTGSDADDGAGPPATTTATRLPIRAVMISPSRNGEAAEASLRSLLVNRGYDVPVLRSAIPFRGPA